MDRQKLRRHHKAYWRHYQECLHVIRGYTSRDMTRRIEALVLRIKRDMLLAYVEERSPIYVEMGIFLRCLRLGAAMEIGLKACYLKDLLPEDLKDIVDEIMDIRLELARTQEYSPWDRFNSVMEKLHPDNVPTITQRGVVTRRSEVPNLATFVAASDGKG